MEWVLENWDTILVIIAGVIAAASGFVKITPTPKDNKALRTVRKILEKLSLMPKENQTK